MMSQSHALKNLEGYLVLASWWIKLVLARISIWKFKNGKREDGFSMLDQTMVELTRRTKGFRGLLTFLSLQEHDTGIIITLWDNEESLDSSSEGIFRTTTQKLEPYVVGPPEVRSYRTFSAELRQ